MVCDWGDDGAGRDPGAGRHKRSDAGSGVCVGAETRRAVDHYHGRRVVGWLHRADPRSNQKVLIEVLNLSSISSLEMTPVSVGGSIAGCGWLKRQHRHLECISQQNKVCLSASLAHYQLVSSDFG